MQIESYRIMDGERNGKWLCVCVYLYAGVKCDLRTKYRTRDRYEISSRTRLNTYIGTYKCYITYNHVLTIHQNM